MTLREVLIVDDSDSDLLFARVVLESVGVSSQIRTFETGHDVLAYLNSAHGGEVDLILVDINMPEMNGFEFLQAYEKLRKAGQSHAVAVMLTSSSDPRDKERAFAFPCVKRYLVKPLDVAAAAGLTDVVESNYP